MPTHTKEQPTASRAYQITVEGKIDEGWTGWFGNLQLSSYQQADGVQVTTLSGVLRDQAALRGLLNRLWDLNLVVRAVYQVDPLRQSEQP